MTLTILCVDDNSLDAELLRRRLERVPGLGFEFHHCATASEALAWHDERRADLIFVDGDLGDLDAIQLLEAMRARGPVGRTVLFTGQIDESARPALEALGCRTWLDKNDPSPGALEAILRAQP